VRAHEATRRYARRLGEGGITINIEDGEFGGVWIVRLCAIGNSAEIEMRKSRQMTHRYRVAPASRHMPVAR